MAWDYKREEQKFEVLPEGAYRIRVKSAEKAQSSKGNDMLALQFEVSGNKAILYHYIVFLDDRPEITNRMLTSFFDAFPGIPEGDFNLNNWLGKVGACRVRHEEYNGNETAKIHYFIRADKQDELPPWREPYGSAPVKMDADGFMDVSGNMDELPFV